MRHIRCSVDGGFHEALAEPFQDVPLCQTHADAIHLTNLSGHLGRDSEWTFTDGEVTTAWLEAFGADEHDRPAIILRGPGGSGPTRGAGAVAPGTSRSSSLHS
jgi:hypothetical protein